MADSADRPTLYPAGRVSVAYDGHGLADGLRRKCPQRASIIVGRMALMVIGLCLAAGCERKPPPAPQARLPHDAHIAFIGRPAGSPQAAALELGARAFAERRALPRVRFSRPASDTPEALGPLIDDALRAEPAAALIAIPPGGLSADDAARLARLSGPLVIIGPVPDNITPSGSVDVDWAEGAALLGGSLAQIAPDARSALLLHDRGRDAAAAGRYERFIEHQRVRAGLRLLDQREWRTAGPAASELIGEMLTTFPNAGVIAAITGEPCDPLAAPESAAVAGVRGRVALLGAHPRRWRPLREGAALALVGAIEPRLATEALDLAIGLCNGRPAGERRLIPCELVTRAALDDFARRYAEAAGALPAELEAIAESAVSDGAGGS